MTLCLNLSSSQALVSKHVALPIICPLPSDYKVGFGGKFGVQTDRQDKSAAGWDHIEKVEKHESQTDHKKGFGGKYGVGVQDKSAVGWEHHEKVDKHESQKGPPLSVQSFVTSCLSLSDYKSGFGGKFGVQNDRVDASAVGWEHHEKVDKHESQKGELCIFSLPICPDIISPICSASYACRYFFYLLKTTRRGSAASLGSRTTGWTRARQGGTMWRRCQSTPANRVGYVCN